MPVSLSGPLIKQFCLPAAFVFLAMGATEPPQTFEFPEPGSTSRIQLGGVATAVGTGVRLTPARQKTAGVAWFRDRVRVSYGFDTTFTFRITSRGGAGRGADGFALVLQNAGADAIGSPGGAGGFSLGNSGYNLGAIPHSIAVFFDTFRNLDSGDPSDNFIQICTTGSKTQTQWPPPRLALSPNLAIHLKDGHIHKARILYTPPVINVFLDDSQSPVLKSVVDLGTIVDSDGRSFVGFTASTGEGWENHDILSWKFSNAGFSVDSSIWFTNSEATGTQDFCLPEKNLCTPGKATIDRTDTGYHVILPANLKWGASVPTPRGKRVVVNGAKGRVCWDFKSLGDAGCNGPQGNGLRAGEAFLAPEAQAGALVSQTTADSTMFTVNGRADNNFRDNEGYFEFDVLIQ